MGKANIIEAVAVNSRIDFRYAFKIQKQNGIELYIKKKGTSLAVQQLKLHTSTRDPIWIPGWGTEISTSCGSW